jgi:hypothetical protein
MTMKIPIVDINNLQEVGIMNTHISDHIANEKIVESMRSIELFIGIVVVVSVVGFLCLAAV